MARPKMKCNGKNLEGTPCNNRAVQDSFYCQLHQSQETAHDREIRKNSDSTASVILILIVVIGFILRMAFGYESEFVNWLGR